MTEHVGEPKNFGLGNVTKIVMMALAVALLCVSAVIIMQSINQRSDQQNANVLTRRVDQLLQDNKDLQDELRCLRPAALDYDEAVGNLSLDISRILTSIISDSPLPEGLGTDLGIHSIKLSQAIDARRASITTCSTG